MKNESVFANVATALSSMGCMMLSALVLIPMLACIAIVYYAGFATVLEGNTEGLPCLVGMSIPLVIAIVVIVKTVKATNARNAAQVEQDKKQAVMNKVYDARFQQRVAAIRDRNKRQSE